VAAENASKLGITLFSDHNTLSTSSAVGNQGDGIQVLSNVERIGEDSDARNARGRFFEQLDPLGPQRDSEKSHSGEVTSGPREACYELRRDGIATEDEHDGH
jgi:hypothetical protein